LYILSQYVNSHDEVTSGDDTDFVELGKSTIQERTIKVDEIKADPSIRKFKPKSRKCKFPDEGSSKYYDVSMAVNAINQVIYFNSSSQIHTMNLCKMDCRIKQALKMCNCVPFFYTVRKVKFCDIPGMLCLSKDLKWYNATRCSCMKMCEDTILTKMSTKDVSAMTS
jgi:hypothetical protein